MKQATLGREKSTKKQRREHGIQQPIRFRPFLETLEDRCLMATIPIWIPQGPGPSQVERSLIQGIPGHPTTGDVADVAINANNPNQVFAATADGGIWMTINAYAAAPQSATWTPLTDNMPFLGMSTIVFSPLDNSNQPVTPSTPSANLVIYAGTGHFSNGTQAGSPVGLYKSSNGGSSWSWLGQSTFANNNNNGGLSINRLVPTTMIDTGTGAGRGGQIVFASVAALNGQKPPPNQQGLYRSLDSGNTWTLLSGGTNPSGSSLTGGSATGLPANLGISDVAADPINNQNLYAALVGQGVYASTDGGYTWQNTAAIPNVAKDGNNRINLAVSKQTGSQGNRPIYVGLVNDDRVGTITNGPPTSFATVGTSYSFTLSAVGSSTPTFTVVSGALPPGLNIVGVAITGVPTLAGTFTGTIIANNAISASASQNFSISVFQPGAMPTAPTITTPAALTMTQKVNGTLTLQALGSPTPKLTLASGALPNGLQFASNNDGTATISGAAAKGSNNNGVFQLTLQAANGVGTTAQQTLDLLVNPPKTSQLTEVFVSFDIGATWIPMGVPNPPDGINGDNQGNNDFEILADSNNPNVVYVGGDIQAIDPDTTLGTSGYVGNHYQGVVDPTTLTTTWKSLDGFGAIVGILAAGTSSGSNTVTTFNDTTQSWTANQWRNGAVQITKGTGNGQLRAVTANTSTTLTVGAPWTTVPDATSEYAITFSAVASAGTATTLTDSAQAWTANQWRNDTVLIIGGKGTGQARTITANTATTLTVDAPWSVVPDATSAYSIAFSSTSTGGNTGTTLNDSTQAWARDQWKGTVVQITAGPGAGQANTITANTATTLTVSSNWTTLPEPTSTYRIGLGTGPHGDSHDFTFDPLGNILEGDDGGIYRLNNPTNPFTRFWSALDGNDHPAIQAIEFNAISVDSVNRIIFGGSQDNGTPQQNATNRPHYTDITGADGQLTQVFNSLAPGQPYQSIRYSSYYNLNGFQSQVFNGSNQPQTQQPTPLNLTIEGTDKDNLSDIDSLPFFTIYATNAVDPTRLLIGTDNYLYESAFGTPPPGTSNTVSGTSSGTNTATTLNDISQAWTPNQWQLAVIQITGGTGAGQLREIASNTADTITVSASWNTVPDQTSTYAITGQYQGGNTLVSLGGLSGNTPQGAVGAVYAIAYGGMLDGKQNPDVAYIGTDGSSALLLRSTPPLTFQGTATGGSSNTLIDNTQAWTPNQWQTAAIRITKGRGAGQVRDIASNSATGLAVTTDWKTIPDATSQYAIFPGNPTSSAGLPNGFNPVTTYTGATPWAIVLDPANWQTVWVLDTKNNVWYSPNATATPFANITGNLGSLAARFNYNDLALYASPRGSVLLAAGQPVEQPGASGVWVNMNPTQTTGAAWSTFGQGLPTLEVKNIVVDANNNLLAAGTFGRGAWIVENLSSLLSPPPVLNLNGPSSPDFVTTFTQGGGPVPIVGATTLTVTDADDPNLQLAHVRITNLKDGAAEVLAATTTGTNITAVYDRTAGLLTLSGIDTVANYQQVLRTVTYNNTAARLNATTRQINFRVNDGFGNSAVVTTTLTIAAQPTSPRVRVGPQPVVFSAGSGPTLIGMGTTVTFSGTLTAGRVTIKNLQKDTAQSLAVNTSGTNISASYDPTSGVLSLTGNDNAANYQKVLSSLTYQDSADAFRPMTRVITLTVDAGPNFSPAAEIDVQIVEINHAPVVLPTAVFQLAPVPANAGNPGTSVFTLLKTVQPANAIIDPDPGTTLGIAVVGADNSNGAWEFSSNGGGTWQGFLNPTVKHATLLTSMPRTLVRFVPKTGFAGTITNGLSLRIWDMTNRPLGFPWDGKYADTSINGGTTPFSSAIVAAGVTVTPPQQGPTVTIGRAGGQANPTTTSPIQFSVVFSAPVTAFSAGSVIITGTAGATTASVSGSGAAFTVSISGMTQTGTVIVSVPAGAVTDAFGNPNQASTGVNVVSFQVNSILASTTVVAAAVAPGSGPTVTVINATTGAVAFTITPYDPAFTGGVNVATGGGIIATAPGAGGGPDVKVFKSDGTFLFGLFPFNPAFTGGVSVAIGDVNGDGVADIIAAAGPGGGPDVKVINGKTGAFLYGFFAFDQRFTGGVTVAAGDMDGDGFADIICGAGAGGGPNVIVISGADGATVLDNFFAYNALFTGGVTVAAEDLNNDGHADIVTGPGPGGGPNVQAFDGATEALLTSFFAYDPQFTGGVRVVQGGVTSTGQAVIRTGRGPLAPVSFNALLLANLDSFFAFDPTTDNFNPIPGV